MEYKIITYPGIKPNFYKINHNGDIFNLKSNREIGYYVDGKGYRRVQLQFTKSNGKRLDVATHRLICWEFNGPFKDKEHNLVNHTDGDKTNNKPENLEWCSNSENVLHAINHGLLNIKRRFEFDEEDIRTACDLIIYGLSNMEIVAFIYKNIDIHSEEQNNFRTTLTCIRKGKSYHNILKECENKFDIEKYKDLDREDLNEKLKVTRINRYESSKIKKEIKKYYDQGLNKMETLEKITGHRISNATIYTTRVYRLISDVFK